MIRIAHLADVHIRNTTRHAEYRAVFEEFANQCRTEKVDLIFIGGDLFHTKCSGMSPECIEFMCWFFNRLAEVADVHVVLGNHDLNLSNKTRQDAISPIVSALNNPRIFLYKKSGVYPFAPGFNWCVFSLFDEEGWGAVKPVDGDVNIACYHGGIRNSVTETDWKVEEGPDLAFFEPYQVALLGDIHRLQYLGYRNDKPWIAYPGTAVCQNYAEENYKHGYLIWEIERTGKVTHVEHRSLEQPNPHCTLDWEGDFEAFKKKALEKKHGTRFRIRSSQYIAQDDYKRISDLLKNECKAHEVVFKLDHEHTKDVFSAGGLEMMRDDLRNVEVQMLLLKDFYRDVPVTSAEWEKISGHVSRYLKGASLADDAPRNVKWTLKDLSFDNLFTYGRDNRVNFDKLRGIIGIFGPNRVGKSSIVGALMYGLYNSSDRGAIKNLHLVNARKGYGEARIRLAINSTEYEITRETSKTDTRRGETVAATSLDVNCLDATGLKTRLNGEARTDTEKNIRKIIGTQDDFLLTSMSTQGDLTRFINEGSSFRKLILTKFLDLDIFEKMYVMANKDVSMTSAALRSMPEKKWDEERASLEKKLANYEEFLTRVNTRLEALRSEMQELQVKVALHQNVTPVSEEIIERCKLRIQHLEATQSKSRKRLEQWTVSIDETSKQLDALREELKDVDIKSLESERENGLALKQSLTTLKHQLEREKTALDQINKSMKRLDVVPCGDKFPSCMFIKDSHADKERRAGQVKVVEDLEASVKRATDALVAWEEQKVSARISEYQTKKAREQKLAETLSSLRLSYSQEEGDVKEGASQLAAEHEKLSDLEMALKKNESLGLIALRNQVTKIQEEVRKFDGMRIEAATGKGKVDSDLIKLNDQEQKWTKFMGELRTYELIANAFSKRGIPTRIINSQLPAINSEIRDILQGVVEYTVELVADEESNAMEIYLNYGDSRRLIELGSGMEKMFAALAIRVALHKVTSLPKTDIFVLDEGFGVLDETNVEACNRLLVALKKHFRAILVITHVDAVKDVADSVIEITRNEKDSRVYFE